MFQQFLHPGRAITRGASFALVLACVAPARAEGPAVLAEGACTRQTSAPAIIHHAGFADARFRARSQSVVRVELGHDGLVRGVRLLTSSGDGNFDAAAVASARASAFAPAARHCVAIDTRFDEAFTATREGAVVATIGPTPVTATALR